MSGAADAHEMIEPNDAIMLAEAASEALYQSQNAGCFVIVGPLEAAPVDQDPAEGRQQPENQSA